MDAGRRSFLGGAAGAALVAADPLRAQAVTTIDDVVRVSGVVGAGGAIVEAGGATRVFLSGRTRVRGGRPLFANDRWHIGSNTKAMTAALYARAVEAGRARWDATVPQLFPDIDVDAGWAGVAVEQLMSHAGGVTDAAIDGAWLLARHADRADVAAQRTAFARAVLTAPPAGTPGTFAYGNAGYVLLGAAIERAAGTTWEAAMTRDLFAPLGLTSAGFGAPPSIGPWGHAAGAAGPVAADPEGTADNPAAMGPAGRVHLALGDYARFLRIFLGGDAGFLPPDAIARLTTSATAPGYAGGWSVGREAGERLLVHEGSNTLWHAIARLRADRGIGYVAVVNEGGSRGRAAARAIIDELARSQD